MQEGLGAIESVSEIIKFSIAPNHFLPRSYRQSHFTTMHSCFRTYFYLVS